MGKPSWAELNKRQQHYLKAVYEVDQSREAAIKSEGARGRWSSTPASEWRWLPYNASGAMLLRKIEDAGYRDEGTGSTFAALERRGLVLCKYERVLLGVSILFVQITRDGRKLVREALGIKAPKALPIGTLRKWHWSALCRAYVRGEQGMSYDNDTGDGFGYVSRNTFLRLRDYSIKGQPQPLIAITKSACEPYLSIRWPGDSGVMASERSAYCITAFGQEYYREHWHYYRELYPDVDAPVPTDE